MWLFTKNGHLNLVQQGTDPNQLVVQSQTRENLDQVVAALDAVTGHKHEILATNDGGYRFQVVAARKDIAQTVARLVSEIDYSSLMRSVSFDFGSEPGYLLLMQPNGLQVARVNPE
jgi:hypothetical protein